MSKQKFRHGDYVRCIWENIHNSDHNGPQVGDIFRVTAIRDEFVGFQISRYKPKVALDDNYWTIDKIVAIRKGLYAFWDQDSFELERYAESE